MKKRVLYFVEQRFAFDRDSTDMGKRGTLITGASCVSWDSWYDKFL